MLGGNTNIVNVCMRVFEELSKCCVTAFKREFFEHYEGYSEHGIFHGIVNRYENKLLNIKDKIILFAIEWE